MNTKKIRWMQDKYAPFLLSTKSKALNLLATAGLLLYGVYGAREVHTCAALSRSSYGQYLSQFRG